jgi:hypothetical protein
MRINNWLTGFSSRQTSQQFYEARLVRIAHGRFAIWLDPFGMLDSQVVVNLLLELRVGVNLMTRGCWPGARYIGAARRLVPLGASVRALHFETNEFHKRLSV